jgi:hypothetical protein
MAARKRRVALEAREQPPVERHAHDHGAHLVPADDDPDLPARWAAGRGTRDGTAEDEAHVPAGEPAELSPIEVLERALDAV